MNKLASLVAVLLCQPYTAKRRDVMENTPPPQISQGQSWHEAKCPNMRKRGSKGEMWNVCPKALFLFFSSPVLPVWRWSLTVLDQESIVDFVFQLVYIAQSGKSPANYKCTDSLTFYSVIWQNISGGCRGSLYLYSLFPFQSAFAQLAKLDFLRRVLSTELCLWNVVLIKFWSRQTFRLHRWRHQHRFV